MIKNTPAVSVIIPTYNREGVIGRALHSVLNQTYQDFEIIVVDDGSTDSTNKIVESFQDSRIRYIRHSFKMGAAAARNTGIKASNSEFIAFQDSDDEWLCDKLKKQMTLFSKLNNNIGVVYTGFLRVDSNEAIYFPSKKTKKNGNILQALLNGNFITTQAAIIRRECFDKTGLFDEALPRFQDWDLFIRIAKNYEFCCIDEPLLMVFHSSVSITSNDDYIPIALKIILGKNRDVFMKNKPIYAKHCYTLGRLLCSSDSITDGIKYFEESIKHNPYRMMSWYRWAISLPASLFHRLSSKLIDNK